MFSGGKEPIDTTGEGNVFANVVASWWLCRMYKGNLWNLLKFHYQWYHMPILHGHCRSLSLVKFSSVTDENVSEITSS